VQTDPGIVYQFGPFEVNPASGELLKDGRRIRLQELPHRLLVALLENPGEVISREELRSRLWPDDTFVDFDSSLRVAVGKLREALDDNAEAPRYVETIPKRGYRFLVTEVRHLEPTPEVAESPNDPEPLQTSSAQVAATQSRTPLLKYSIAAVTVIVLMAGGIFFWHQRAQATPLTDKDVLVLADFINTTGDPVFDGTLRQALAIQLEQSPFLKIMDDEQVQKTMRLMSLASGTHITNQIAQDICVRDAAAATIDGSIASLGKSYVVTLQAITCQGGASLAREQVQADDKEHVLSALGSAATAMRGRLGESRSSIQKFDTPLEQATTPSLEALKAYSSGIQTTGTKGPVAAIPFFKRAIELDPNFAAAYAYLGILTTSALEPGLSVEYRTKAYKLRDRTSAAERYWVTAAYEKGVTGNIPKAIEACDLWIQAYPRSYLPHVYLGGAVLPIVGQYERATEESTEGIRLSPDYPFPYAYRILAYTALNRFDEAKATYAQALERKLQSPYLSLGMYNVAFALNDSAGMTQQVAKMEALPRWGHTMLFLEGDTAAYNGHIKEAREFTRRAMDSAQQAGEKDATAIYSGLSGLREVSLGNPQEARRYATLALKLSNSRDVLEYAALALAYSGDDAHAKALADDLNTRFPEDTLVQFNYLPTIHGKLALNKGNATDAIKDLEAAVPYELGVSRAGDFIGNMMFPAFVRGEAYLASRQASKAVAEFQKILDHRGLVLNCPIGALAHLGLGRAYALQGDTVKARAAYQDFLTLWKDADPDIPVLQQAKAEYAKL
jgi:DNA-binding winged helix-turn-helix (wHTH) protein/tetratricopeptide (TPR) repeat protein